MKRFVGRKDQNLVPDNFQKKNHSLTILFTFRGTGVESEGRSKSPRRQSPVPRNVLSVSPYSYYHTLYRQRINYAGSRDYVGTPQSPQKTSNIFIYPTEVQTFPFQVISHGRNNFARIVNKLF